MLGSEITISGIIARNDRNTNKFDFQSKADLPRTEYTLTLILLLRS